MDKKVKYKALSGVSFFVIFMIIWIILYFAFENLSVGYKGMITGGLTAILAPRVNELKTQSGSKMQLKWIFLKKTISI